MAIPISFFRRATIGALALRLLVAALAGTPVALPGCRESCGKRSVPYPFGIGDGCFHEGFNLTCDETQHPPRLLMGDGVEVLGICLPDATVRVNGKILISDSPEFNGTWSVPQPFEASSIDNWFVAFGCNILAELDIPRPESYSSNSMCAATCVDNRHVTWTSACSGIGTCRASIMLPAHSYFIRVTPMVLQRSMAADNFRRNISPAAFIVDKAWFSIYGHDMIFDRPQVQSMLHTVPVVLEWSLGPNWRCIGSGSIGSNSVNYWSTIYEGDNRSRMLCNCSEGYEGNPYIANGCQDINECLQPHAYPCHGHCINMPGTYRCSSRTVIRSLPGLITIIAISAGFGLLFSFLGVTKINNKLKQRRARMLRLKCFKKNHGLLLQQLISSDQTVAEKMKIFSLEELEQATNNFHQNRILGGGGHGTVYKGILSDQRVVAIKKSKIVVQREIDQFLNEVVILSQTNHRNVVKLFGCCLETEVPLLVYEFISNGTLSYHLHGQIENPLSWKDRLRIALETARAIAYLHSAASISVFHRDIKSANILLSDTLTAKVSDFGASRSISINETGIVTTIQGTYGYLDPEYFHTSRLTEKSDVYSFGVILAELLTRITPIFSSRTPEVKSLASHFVSLVRDNRMWDILDPQIAKEGGTDDAEIVAKLAEACLNLNGEERPTMRQVETTLEDVQSSKAHLCSQITRVSQNVPKDQPYSGSKDTEGTRIYSLEKEFIQSSEIPR